MTPDSNRPRREPHVIEPEIARLMGMSEEERLQYAAGNYYSMDEIIRIIEVEFGTGEGESGSS